MNGSYLGRIAAAVILLGVAALMCNVLTAPKATPGEILMVQPGRNPFWNLTQSEANLNNSEANVNNAYAENLPEVMDAQAEWLKAQSCAIRNDCGLYSYQAGQRSGGTTLLLWVVSAIVAFVAGFTLLSRRTQ